MKEGNLPLSTRPRVLCIDDDEDSRVMLTALLKLSFIDSKAVATAAHALSLIRAEHFDLYLLDAWLPEVDGFELCRRMRAFDPHTPILFFSGAAYETDKRKGIEAGANAYVAKPDIYRLVENVKRFTSPAPEYKFAKPNRMCSKVIPVSGQHLWTLRQVNSAFDTAKASIVLR
jgi:DNA-binding response OmpR family regulator